MDPLSLEGSQHLFLQHWGISHFRATANHCCGAESVPASHVQQWRAEQVCHLLVCLKPLYHKAFGMRNSIATRTTGPRWYAGVHIQMGELISSLLASYYLQTSLSGYFGPHDRQSAPARHSDSTSLWMKQHKPFLKLIFIKNV